ncbi:MAG: tetratricopeptide repeat protein [Planctomycetes bacterium]|nr:tetratricopeptide repeat protein [Planctomycetota bacterium]
MPYRRRLAPVVLVLASTTCAPRVARGEDPPTAAGPKTSDLARARSLAERADLLRKASKLREAVAAARESLALLEQALGKDHPDVATSLDDLAGLLLELGEFSASQPLCERALAIREKALGPDDLLVAASRNRLGLLSLKQGAYDEARRQFERALAVREKALGPDHPLVAAVLQNLTDAHRLLGAYDDAQRCGERALAIDERAFGPEHPTVASDLNTLAVVRRSQGALDEARLAYLRALAIQEKTLGKDHAGVAMTLHNLARVLEAQGADAEARRSFERAVAVCEKALGPEHPTFAGFLNNYGAFLRGVGAHDEALALTRRALGIRERTLAKDHPDLAESLDAVAGLLRDQGAYDEARPLYERSLAIYERRLGRDHPKVGSGLNNLAILLELQGALEEAKAYYERALAVWESVAGPDHPYVAMVLTNLSGIHVERGELAAAQAVLERALAIKVNSLGEEHLSVASTRERLAGVHEARGAFAEAKPLYERAILVMEKTLGADHPTLSITLNNYALLLQRLHAYSDARPVLERALRGAESHVRSSLPALTSRQRLASLRTLRVVTGHWVTLARHLGISGYEEMLRVRGLVSRAEAAERALSRRAPAEDRALYGSLQEATRLAARLASSVPSARSAAAIASWQQRYGEAVADRARLAREVQAKSRSARSALERLDLSLGDVQRRLDGRTALVDVARVPDGYVAWVVRATGDPLRLDVGAAETIDAACHAFVAAVAGDAGDEASAGEIRATGTALRSLVWAPLEAKLGAGVERVVIRPDAALAAIPFGALPGREAGRFLLDEYALVHVMQPHDLVPRGDAPALGVGALVVGGVDYERAQADRVAATPPKPDDAERAPSGRPFSPLPETRLEAEALHGRFGAAGSELLLGADASESRLRAAVKGRRFVHVATHGFARDDLLAGLYTRRIEEAFTSADVEAALAGGHDPMLLSGLALAGANPRDGAHGDDGILTALEASYLDLDGADLVTLSACETARGTAESGEGVLGLVAGFQMAGARRVIASLWKVDDEATRLLMEGVYARMLRTEDPRSPADALREAALALRATKDPAGRVRFAAPRHWAAFVAYGL